MRRRRWNVRRRVADRERGCLDLARGRLSVRRQLSPGSLLCFSANTREETRAQGGWRHWSWRSADERVYLGVGGHTLSTLVAPGHVRGDGAHLIGWQRAFREGGKRRRGR